MEELKSLIKKWEHPLPIWMIKNSTTNDIEKIKCMKYLKKIIEKYKPEPNDYTHFFKQLGNVLKETNYNNDDGVVLYKTLKNCCNNPDINYNNTYTTCINCCKVSLDNFIYVEPNVYLNKKFHLSTTISGSSKFNTLKRFHQWGNYNYKETTLMKTLKIFEIICNHFEINNIILDRSKFLYKTIYIDNKISSRSNIKNAMYIYCIYESCKEKNFKIDLEDLIDFFDKNIKNKYIKKKNIKKKKVKFTIDHYSKCLKKIEKYLNIKNEDNTIFIDVKLKKKYEICIKKKLDINKIELITLYNKYKTYNTTKKINNNSIILGVIYLLVKDKVNLKRFIKIFKTTKITLKKFFNLVEIKILKINC